MVYNTNIVKQNRSLNMKKVITKRQFEIEVEKEFGFLTYQDGLSDKEARIQADKNVREKYVVEGSAEAKAQEAQSA